MNVENEKQTGEQFMIPRGWDTVPVPEIGFFVSCPFRNIPGGRETFTFRVLNIFPVVRRVELNRNTGMVS